MDRETISSIKSLGIDMITHAKSGHPGIVLGAAPMLYTLYAYHLNINKKDRNWINRDRFVMSAGHGSALLYATIFMAGIDYTIEDLKSFRKLGSKTPGHPEYTNLNTIEVTTGPLGEGLATSVGIALGERILNQKTKINKNSLIDFNTYCLCGDGDLMEGIATEAASFAGAMKLSNLIVLYDSNNISLDGKTNITFNENIRDKFSSLGWSVYLVKNGNNIKEINKAIEKAKKSNKPSLIEIKTIIGDGSNLKNTNSVHGKPLEKDDIDQLKQKLDMPDEMFIYSENAKKYFSNKISDRIDKKYDKWIKLYDEYIKDEKGKYTNSSIGTTFVYDKRDSAMFTRDGYFLSAGTDVAGLGGDEKYVKFDGKAYWYNTMADYYTLKLFVNAGMIEAYGDETVRLANRYFLGGYTMRGFEAGGIGARDKYTNDALGGNWMVYSGAEFGFPIGLDELGISAHVFTDVGMIGKPDNLNTDDIYYSDTPRVSVGFGFQWLSPMGQIDVDFGFPIVKEDYDETEVFRLNFGTRL